MKTQDYIAKMKKIHESMITYIDNEDDIEESHQNLVKLFND